MNIEKIHEEYIEIGSLQTVAKNNNINRCLLSKLFKQSNLYVREVKNKNYRKYKMNEVVFCSITGEAQSYVIGFLFADGYNNTDIGVTEVWVNPKDKDIIEKIQSVFETNAPIRERQGEHVSVGLPICSRKVSDDLEKIGMVKAKSTILTYPTKENISDKLERHFIRGYFDGDGSINCSKGRNERSLKKIEVSIQGSEDFLLDVQKTLANKLNVRSKIKLGNGNIFVLLIQTYACMLKFLDWMYYDSKLYLNRKYEKYLEVKKELLRRSIVSHNKYFNAKIARENAQTIVTMYGNGCTLSKIAERYNTTRNTIKSILKLK